MVIDREEGRIVEGEGRGSNRVENVENGEWGDGGPVDIGRGDQENVEKGF